MSQTPSSRSIIPLEPHELLVQTAWGGWLVVPTFNIDVAIGPVRDGIIEPWTTRLVQECLRPGDSYFNAGGNYGYYVALAGVIVGSAGRVITVEPNPHIVPYLLKTTYWSGIVGHTDVYRAALWHEAGQEVEFHFDPQYLGGGSARSLWDVSFSDAGKANDLGSAIWSAENIHSLFDAQGKWRKGKGNFVPFKVMTQTIDAIVAGEKISLIHLDIEGAEPFALQGAKETIRSNPDLRLITEWASHTYQYGSEQLRSAFREAFEFLTGLGYRARHLEPRIADDGGIYLSHFLDFDQLTTTAIHGDYYWTR